MAEQLVREADHFHDLVDFYVVYGYPPEIEQWANATDRWGRQAEEVAELLGLDLARLRKACWHESHDDGSVDPEGNPVFYPKFWDNFAVGDMAGRFDVDPSKYRFKAWLSLHH